MEGIAKYDYKTEDRVTLRGRSMNEQSGGRHSAMSRFEMEVKVTRGQLFKRDVPFCSLGRMLGWHQGKCIPL